MSVTDQLTRLAHQGYPSSGESGDSGGVNGEPFGPGGDTALHAAVRGTAPRRRIAPTARPTEEQAAQAQRCSVAAHTAPGTTMTPRLPDKHAPGTHTPATASPKATALPVLTPRQIAEHRADSGHRSGVPAALAEPIGAIVGWVLAKAGYGVNGPRYTPKEH